MTTLNGPWEGGSTNGRIVCIYTVTRTADNTQAIYDGDLYFETDQYTTDSVNQWEVEGDDGNHSGSNVAYNFGSGGAKKKFYGFVFQKYGDGSITGRVKNVEAVGVTVNATFSLNAPTLAPYFGTSEYGVSAVTPSSFTVTMLSVFANGGTMENVQVEYNTIAGDTGASYYLKGSYAAATITGLQANKTYYYRVRVANSTFGWSAWGSWKSVKTTAGLPGQPASTWSLTKVDQVSALVKGATADAGGSAITNWIVEWDTDPAFGSPDNNSTSGSVNDMPLAFDLVPNTLYFFRIRAWNANGLGAWSDVKNATTQPSAYVNVGGVWKPATAYIKTATGWKIATRYTAASITDTVVNWKQ